MQKKDINIIYLLLDTTPVDVLYTTLSQETIKKMSEAKKGKPWSEKRRAAYLKKTYNEQIS